MGYADFDRSAPVAVKILIAGGFGVGKTTLAVHFAHQVAERFPDGQLYVNLRGFDPAGPQMTPVEAISLLLDGLAVSAAVLLVTGFVASGLPAALITIFVACTFGILWFAFPLSRRG